MRSAQIFIIVVAASACRKTPDAVTSSTPSQDSMEFILNEEKVAEWEGDTSYWKIKDNTLIGEVTPETPLHTNTFFIWKTELDDFELKAEFRITEAGNSGINYRSAKIPNSEYGLTGYQCDIDGRHVYTGQNYEERGRTTLAYKGEAVIVDPTEDRDRDANIVNNAWTIRRVLAGSATAGAKPLDLFINKNGWNECHLVVKGNNLKHYVNNVLASYVTDNDTINRRNEGFLGFQLHAGPPMKVEYRNVRIKKL